MPGGGSSEGVGANSEGGLAASSPEGGTEGAGPSAWPSPYNLQKMRQFEEDAACFKQLEEVDAGGGGDLRQEAQIEQLTPPPPPDEQLSPPPLAEVEVLREWTDGSGLPILLPPPLHASEAIAYKLLDIPDYPDDHLLVALLLARFNAIPPTANESLLQQMGMVQMFDFSFTDVKIVLLSMNPI
ncbi:hypothetical protein T492DRAFT_902411 [Pavlovales sp. CCMP2436]|nr:hypothetical protein T492DRAFT_902411 [Pavlovales sp. CCMP2436]